MDREEVESYGRCLLQAMTERDLATIEELLHPDICLRSLIAGIGREFRGLDGIRRYFAELDESFGDVRWDFVEVAAQEGDVAVVESRFRARGLASGIEIDELHAQVWRWRDGRGHRNEVHRTRDEALAAAEIGTR